MAAKLGWKRRIAAALKLRRARSGAAKKGWETRRKRAAARKRREQRNKRIEVYAFPSNGVSTEAPEDGHMLYTYAGGGYEELPAIFKEPYHVERLRIRDESGLLVHDQNLNPRYREWADLFALARSIYDNYDSSHGAYFFGPGKAPENVNEKAA